MDRTNGRLKLQLSIMLTMFMVTQWVLAAPEKQLIIKYKDEAPLIAALSAQTASQRQQTMQAAAVQLSQKVNVSVSYVRPLSLKGHHIFKILGSHDANNNLQEIIQQLSTDPEIEYIEEDRLLQAFFTPNDTLYPEQWHYHDSAGGLNLPNAWDHATGSGVVVAVIDSGYRPHADLNANLLPGYDMVSHLFTQMMVTYVIAMPVILAMDLAKENAVMIARLKTAAGMEPMWPVRSPRRPITTSVLPASLLMRKLFPFECLGNVAH
ncbi:MAG: hypothetical protein GXP14_17290 [Gammaproteobacteria bacterium]|nr:hypothetical protein [Gammaproteobacteria bacterium]